MHVTQSFGNILVQISTLYTYQKPTYRSINVALYSYTATYRYFKWLQWPVQFLQDSHAHPSRDLVALEPMMQLVTLYTS